LKLAQTSLKYDQVTWLPLSHTIKSFWELESQTLYFQRFEGHYSFHLQGEVNKITGHVKH